MKSRVAVDILGNRTWIESISSQPADPPWQTEDRITVWLMFEKSAGITLSFCVHLPVRRYTKDGFLAAVRRYGEHRLKETLGGESKEQNLEALDQRTAEIRALIGLE